MDRDLDALSECPDCGLLQHLSPAPNGFRVTCVRCDAVLRRVREFSLPFSMACGAVGLVLLGLATAMPVASVFFEGGRFVAMDLGGALARLQRTGAPELSLAIVLTLLVFPFSKLATVVTMGLYTRTGRAPRSVKYAFSKVSWLSSWAMVDVFLLGAMVSLFRLEAWGRISFGPALYALMGVAVCSLAIDGVLDPRPFWRRLQKVDGPRPEGRMPVGCQNCDAVVFQQAGSSCPRCELRITDRKTDSMSHTWAFLIAAAALLVPANVLPVMEVTKMGKGGPSTIMGGTVELVEHGLFGLALLVFVASVIVPIFKLAALALLLWTTSSRSSARLLGRTKLYRFIALIGRWSMLDIFATMTLVGLAKLGLLANVVPGAGASAFCGVVLFTMIAAERFDARLMWDAAGRNPGRASIGGSVAERPEPRGAPA